jgi:hypothetical protein
MLPTLSLIPSSSVNTAPSSQPSASIAPSFTSFEPIRINSGGTSFTDIQGRKWLTDKYFIGGSTSGTIMSISGEDASLFPMYKTERWSPTLRYEIPVDAPGLYNVTIHLADIYTKTQTKGTRVFDISINDVMVFPNIDIVDLVGGYAPLVLSHVVEILDGQDAINIQFHKGVENPKISGIEITQAEASTQGPSTSPSKQPSISSAPSVAEMEPSSQPSYGPTRYASSTPSSTEGVPSSQPSVSAEPLVAPFVIRINAGGSAFTDSNGHEWMADVYFAGGNAEVVSDDINASLEDYPLYQSERWGKDLKYEIPVDQNGNYEVALHFAETYPGAMGDNLRVFNVSINGEITFGPVDIFKAADEYAPMILSTRVEVDSNKIVIAFEADIENPKVSGIEITGPISMSLSGTSSAPSASHFPTSVPTIAPSSTPTKGSAILSLRAVGDPCSEQSPCGECEGRSKSVFAQDLIQTLVSLTPRSCLLQVTAIRIPTVGKDLCVGTDGAMNLYGGARERQSNGRTIAMLKNLTTKH